MTLTTFDMTPGIAKSLRPIDRATFVGLREEDRVILVELINRLNSKRMRNELRRRYYDEHNTLKSLGIAIPPSLTTVQVVAGWPAKAVDSMSRRTVLEGMVSASGGEELAAIVRNVWEDNSIDFEASAAHTSALIHSCAFGFVHAGDTSAGEPPVLITMRSAESATGVWSRRLRGLTSALSIVEEDVKTGQPTIMNLYLPNRVVTLRRSAFGVYDAEEQWHGMGVPVEVLPYRADLDRPFGRSRITRAVMYNTDAAMRTMLRTEVGAEFYNAPQRYALGADEDAFKDKAGNVQPAWTVMLGRMLTMTKDEDGDLPQVGQFAQQTMQPNIEQLRAIAQMFAAETSLPVGSLGIVQDNPESAEAIRARHEELGIEIEHWERTALAPAWRRLMIRAVAMSTDSPAAISEAVELQPVWGSWSAPSEVSQAQAAQARINAIPALAETDVELERMGYTPSQIERVKMQMSRSRGASALDRALAAAQPQQPAVADQVQGGAGDVPQ